jgi:chemotaxis protein histidine kinase CheA
MTVSTTIIKNFHNGNASTTNFAYQFRILEDTDLLVIIRTNSTGAETTKTLSTHYTVAGAGDASGGSITFTVGNTPAIGETVVIRRNVPQTQAIDYIANDPFPAETHEEGLDRGTMVAQQVAEESDRSIKLSRTNTMTSTEFTVGATDRANKVLAFDSAGEISVTQELGTFKGSDTTTTTAAYVQRDIIKSTTAGQLNNVYICVADSIIGDTLTDTDHFALLVDAVSAATSATNAAASEAAAASSATDAQTAQTAAETAETNAETAETNAETAETNAATSETNAAASESAAATSETNAATSETNAAASASSASTSASTATTQASNASTSASNAATSESNASTSASNASTSASNASTSESNASTSASTATTQASNAAASASAAAASADAFDDVYLGSKSSDPTTDNDGDPLAAGMLYYNSVSNIMRIYSGSAWENVAVSLSKTSLQVRLHLTHLIIQLLTQMS